MPEGKEEAQEQKTQESLKECAGVIYKMLMDDIFRLNPIENVVLEGVAKDIFSEENVRNYGLISYERFVDNQRYSYDTSYVRRYISYFYKHSSVGNILGTFTSLRFAIIGIIATHDMIMNLLNKQTKNNNYAQA